ncbi:hypothetical protein [Marinitoga lauensis]|uniref:hypothetical protein n=1 Tax=Marinitoga lauensis TaxID=2201189 RepID=UPI001010B5B5|nr:hypothetical protein [Marinitoga lauensis]
MKYLNMEGITIENDYIKLVVLPNLGAKIASIYYKPQNFEVLFQPTLKKYNLPKYGDSFAQYDTSGSDEMFPNIDKGIYPFEEYYGEILPDHGELWSIPWNCKIIGNNIIESIVDSPKFNYTFKRIIELKNNKIILTYSVKNNGIKKFKGFWTFHGLVAIDKNSKIILNGINRVLNVKKNSHYLGNSENECSYPVYNNYQLNKFLPPEVKNTEKFYLLDKIDYAGITLNNNNLLYLVNFKELPYLGIWKNEGGFKNEYNAAIEPTNGFYDSLEITKKHNKYLTFESGEEKSWLISIELNEENFLA